jgi:DUF4097 and DUF4098 domain-containing protein YvlB
MINEKKCLRLAVLSMFFISSVVALAQEDHVDRVTVKLTDPTKPVFIELGLVNGGITVEGYDGQEVLVEAKTETKQISRSGSNKNVEGMFRIPVFSTSLEVEERNNRIEISTESWKRSIDVKLKVPKQASMNLHCVNDGDIVVENVTGDLEVNNVNGSVTLKNISGSAVAHALNEDLIVTFASINPEKSMSFSSLNGDIDVTFPANLKCDVKIKNDQGDVYSDFEILKVNKPVNVIKENGRSRDGRYQVRIERSFYGTINGGGLEYSFSNFNGDVIIRKAK